MAATILEIPLPRLAGSEFRPRTPHSSLANGLEGAPIGRAPLDLLGGEAVHQEVNAVVRRATERMNEGGAVMVPIRIPNFAELTE